MRAVRRSRPRGGRGRSAARLCQPVVEQHPWGLGALWRAIVSAAMPIRHKDAPPEDDLYAPIEWRDGSGDYEDVLYERAEGIAKITINRPEVHNAFRPPTLRRAPRRLHARPRRHRGLARSSSPAPATRRSARAATRASAATTATWATTRSPSRASAGSTSATSTSRSGALPKPVVAMVAGYAVGGGHILHLVCDMTIAGENARFGQTGPRVGSFDGGFGASLLARNIGVKKAKEFWFLSRLYDAEEALEMGLVNAVAPAGRARARDRRLVPRDVLPLPDGPAAAEVELQRRGGRASRASSSSPTTRRCSST